MSATDKPAASTTGSREVDADVLRLLRSPDVQPFECIRLLEKTGDNFAIQLDICEKLLQATPQQITFWLPQLVHLYVTLETEAAALENTLLELCQSSTHIALCVFWQLQAALSDTTTDPHGYCFVAAKRLSNKMQHMLFASGELPVEHMHENAQPALVLAGMVAASIGLPDVAHHIKTLLEYQGRKQRSSYLIRRPIMRKNGNEDYTKQDGDVSELSQRGQLGLLRMGSQPNLTLSNSEESLDTSKYNRSMPNLSSSDPPIASLKINYFRCQTQFMYALNAISQRLLQVPKEARLSALQVELALLNEDLPSADIDLPVLLPHRHHKQARIVNICVQEATVLNSAEKAPFLLLIEYLRGELTFDSRDRRNREILRHGLKKSTHIFERPPLRNLKDPEPVIEELQAATQFSESEVDLSEAACLDSPARAALLQQQGPISLPVAENEAMAAASVQETRNMNPGPSAADLATQWRTATLILNQLEVSTKLPRGEVQAIKQRIVDSMQAIQHSTLSTRTEAGERRLENDLKTAGLEPSQEDPSAANLGEDWQARKARIRRSSKHGTHPNWDLMSVIVKTGDDLRQEALASQLIQRAAQIWRSKNVAAWVRRMQILITGANTGLVETITNALSVHSIKKALTTAQVSEGADPRSIAQLNQHFEAKFGPPTGNRYHRSVLNFAHSLAGYSVLCYLLQIKDRHNGNILLDSEGHIIHIDFGFMLSNSPGHIGFEVNTFKLTQEYVDLMGGVSSDTFKEFTSMLVEAFLALRTHADEFVGLVSIMSKNSTLPCFVGGNSAQLLKQRFMLDLNDDEAGQAFERLMWKSLNSVYTRLYDQYQLVTQGIYS
ncbi:1-phosphatidylinositol 4-kinase [Starmerella bacillaris]|uniref:1-phosphatidylinositol 4-kinase n=1 Tax=Starmerella bacillaris TaxID=1247836 RepID=A0AAV5RN64_STABA|nr:1-phosphatidylinositol 4-kinase [Starmerella bacillaris]